MVESHRPTRDPRNPVVFFDVSVGGQPAGRMVFELFADVCPKTAENFRQLCTGEFRMNGVPIGYKNSSIHRVVKDFIIQGGDFVRGDGTGSMSIFGEAFPAENFNLAYDSPGQLCMAVTGNTAGCQFFVTSTKCDWLNGQHVVFGAVLNPESMLTVRKIENLEVTDYKPRLPVIIVQCGEL